MKKIKNLHYLAKTESDPMGFHKTNMEELNSPRRELTPQQKTPQWITSWPSARTPLRTQCWYSQ